MDKGGQGEKPIIVIDASVAAKWVLPEEPLQEEARALEEKIVFGEVKAYAPDLFSYEIASVMLKAVRRGVLKIEDGVEALNAIGELGIHIHAADWNDQAEILKIAAATKLTIYDAAYLHLSRKINGKLVTADSKLKKKGESVTTILLLKELKI